MKKIVLLIVISLFFVRPAHAGFPIIKGGGLLVPTYNLYTANGYWDANRKYTVNNGSFVSHYFGLYGGYGISRNVNLVFNLPFVVQNNNGDGSSNASLGDLSVGLSYFLSHFDDTKHLSLTGSLLLPLYQNPPLKNAPAIGFQQIGTEIKLGLSGSSEMGVRNAFYDMEIGVRQYFNELGPTQFFTNITGGTPVGESWKISGTLTGFTSSSTQSSTLTSLNDLYLNRNFDYVRLTANICKVVNNNVSVWGSLFTDVTGRNTGKGSGLGLFVVIKL